jgi:UrcA family protein
MGHLRGAVAGLLLVAGSGAMAQKADITVLGEYLRMGWGEVKGEVKFGDLNLRSDTGVATLKSRVDGEAKRICGAATSDQERRTCEAQVMASAKPQVDKVVANARM